MKGRKNKILYCLGTWLKHQTAYSKEIIIFFVDLENIPERSLPPLDINNEESCAYSQISAHVTNEPRRSWSLTDSGSDLPDFGPNVPRAVPRLNKVYHLASLYLIIAVIALSVLMNQFLNSELCDDCQKQCLIPVQLVFFLFMVAALIFSAYFEHKYKNCRRELEQYRRRQEHLIN